MTKKDGGPAFPNRGDNSDKWPYYDGMTLRDWFAGQALACLATWSINTDPENPTMVNPINEELAKECYATADAMLAERDKETT